MKQLITLISLFVSLNLFGQGIDVNNEIRKDFSNYFKLIDERKMDSAMEYINPKIYDIIPRDQMKNLLEAIYKMPNFEFKTGVPTYLKFDELKEIKRMNYVRFYILSPIEMKFNDIEKDEEKIAQMTKVFENKYGVENVKYDTESGFFKINAQKTVIASSSDLLDWKFATIDNSKMKKLLETVIPAELLD